MTDPQTKPPRGSFPKGLTGETIAQRRERYEVWVLSTHSRLPDYEAQSITFYRDRTKLVLTRPGAAERKEVPAAPSRRLCATSRCWQCQAGDDDPNAAEAIGRCSVEKCGLWPVRPYQELAATPAEPRAGRGDYIGAIRKHCLDCVGSNLQEVRRCTAPTCALFPVRFGAAAVAEETQSSQPAAGGRR